MMEWSGPLSTTTPAPTKWKPVTVMVSDDPVTIIIIKLIMYLN